MMARKRKKFLRRTLSIAEVSDLLGAYLCEKEKIDLDDFEGHEVELLMVAGEGNRIEQVRVEIAFSENPDTRNQRPGRD